MHGRKGERLGGKKTGAGEGRFLQVNGEGVARNIGKRRRGLYVSCPGPDDDAEFDF
jgi:hypothetical protein